MKTTVLAALAIASLAGAANAAILYTTDFNSGSGYVDGALVGQNGWAQTGATATFPVAVANTGSNGFVRLGVTGQDVNHPFAAQTTDSIYLTADVTITTVGAVGTSDYFMHLGDGGISNFYARIYVRAGTGPNTIQFAMSTSSGNIPSLIWGADLSIASTYTLMARYDIVAGLANDAGALFINPTNAWGIGDTAYTTALLTGVDATSISSVNLRQGTTANNVSAIIDNLTVQTIPTPGAAALLGVGMVASARRRRA